MGAGVGREDLGFDFKRAKKCADVYSRSAGVNCIIMDSHGETLYSAGKENGICRFCRRLNVASTGNAGCSSAHLYGCYQAEKFGGKYVFFCSLGLAHWVSTISVEGIMHGALLSGPAMMVEPDEFLLYDLIRERNIKDDEIAGIEEYIKDVPIIKPDRVDSLSELLFIVAAHISDIQPSKYYQDREYNEQQADISEYIHYIKTMGGDVSNVQSYPLEKEKELLSLIALGDKAGSQKVLNEILGHIFFSTGGNFEVIKARVLELIVLLSRAALEGGADVEQIFGLNYKFLNQINGFHTVEELTFWLSGIMARFTDLVFNLADIKHVDVIYKAIDYIKRNYMKKITLEEVASNVYLSVSYFSKIFKEEMKCNFNTYLNKVRVDMSKKLLVDDSIALVDISNLVGFEDQSYFSKVFKKITGVSPGKFRESRGGSSRYRDPEHMEEPWRLIRDNRLTKYIINQNKGRLFIVSILNEISQNLQQGKAKVVKELVQKAIDEGLDAKTILEEGLLSGMGIIGQKFKNNEVYVPDVLIAARAMNAGSELLKPLLVSQGVKATGKVVLGTVKGDLHDIGKNLVRMMMEGKGLEVYDIGIDVPTDKFAEKAIEVDAKIIAMSALLTTTMGEMKNVLESIKNAGLRDKVTVMIGGAPVNENFCKSIGADIYTPDAASAAEAAAKVYQS